MRAGFKPTSLIEYKRFRIIHHRPTRSGEQTILEAGCAANTIQRASRAFEIIGLPNAILPCNTSLLERDGKGFACKAPRCDLIFQMQEIGFDLNEVGVSQNEWDENVGARVLYKLCNLLIASNK